MFIKMKKEMNKKGAEMAVGTIVIIVLALVVLVVLIVGFTSGWSEMWAKLTSIFGGGANVANHVNGCTVACTSNSEYDYCTRLRDVKFDDKTKNGKYNCAGLAAVSGAGLEACEQFGSCGTIGEIKPGLCTALGGTWQDNCGAAEDDITNRVSVDDKGVAANKGKKCCKPKTP